LNNHQSQKNYKAALLLEIVFGFIGFLGIGWIYSGNREVGLRWFFGMLAWDILAAIVLVFTIGVGCVFTFPINLILTAISAVSLHKFLATKPKFSVEN